jgi:hypothetical protein
LDDIAQLRMRCQALLEFCIAFFAQQFLDSLGKDRRFDEDYAIGGCVIDACASMTYESICKELPMVLRRADTGL